MTYRNDVVANFHIRDTFTNALYDTSTLMSENDRESTLGVRACID